MEYQKNHKKFQKIHIKIIQRQLQSYKVTKY